MDSQKGRLNWSAMHDVAFVCIYTPHPVASYKYKTISKLVQDQVLASFFGCAFSQ